MDAKDKKFLLDTNTLIESYRRFYSFSIAQPLWVFLRSEVEAGRVLMLDVVFDEVIKGNDKLSEWTGSIDFKPIDRRSNDILGRYAEVMNHIQNSPHYHDNALNRSGWASVGHADPWIVATAKARNHVVVTMEAPSIPALGNNQTSKIKVPYVCNGLGVGWMNLFETLEYYQFSFSGSKTGR